MTHGVKSSPTLNDVLIIKIHTTTLYAQNLIAIFQKLT